MRCSSIYQPFPTSTSVFKSGGDLAYHHGGPSLQELVIPVITAKLKVDGAVKVEKHAVTVAHDFDAVTNRIFTIRIELGGASKSLFENARKLRPLVLSDDKPVARAFSSINTILMHVSSRIDPKRDRVASKKTCFEQILFQFSRFFADAALKRLREAVAALRQKER
jgi:hypothetical protein